MNDRIILEIEKNRLVEQLKFLVDNCFTYCRERRKSVNIFSYWRPNPSTISDTITLHSFLRAYIDNLQTFLELDSMLKRLNKE